MSKTIHVLDNETIDHIAAGEVVERPLSIVKELVENSIDAGSTAITVEIKGGGIDFIRVTDNGEGIPSNQIDTAFMRHATSKITNKIDLLSISSLGFRGEALSSVCAVSKVELITKTRDEISGSRYVIHGGKKIEQKEVGAPDGSTFVIRDLFYNTPARREFLKTPGTEGRAIEECMTHFTLSHPDIRWQFIGEGKTKLSTSGNADLKTSVYYSFGTEVSKTLIPVSGETEGAKLSGFIAKPDFSRGNRTYMNYFVNGRFIKSKIISAAILDGYRDFLMSHRFPFTALTLDIEPDKIDVNVHPTKLEVRFSDERKIYELIYETIKNTLNNITLIPEETLYNNSSSLSERGTQVNALKQERNTALNQTKINDEINNVYKNTTAESHETKSVTKIESIQPFEQNRLKITPTPVRQFEDTESEKIKENRNQFVEENILKTSDEVEFRIIGQVFETYWMIEYKNELLIIDQHAAHEKVLYEKFVEKMKNKQGLCQELLAPIVVSLSGREQTALEDNMSIFTQMGFMVEPFGEKEYLIKAVPADFLNVSPKELFLDILDTYISEQKGKKPEMVLDHLATMACKAAVKGNNQLSFEEVRALIGQMLKLDEPYHCPHGRPTTVSLSKYELEKKFKRIV